jgi:hypothetical protein
MHILMILEAYLHAYLCIFRAISSSPSLIITYEGRGIMNFSECNILKSLIRIIINNTFFKNVLVCVMLNSDNDL